MRAALFAFLLACVPVAATALSCRPHSVEAAFQQAQEADAHFLIVQGRLDFAGGQMPKLGTSAHSAARTTEITARLTGTSLSARGFATPYNRSVRLRVECYGPWCANVQRGGQVLAFVEQREDGRVIATNPCGGYLFQNPTARMLRAVRGCFAGGACAPVR